MSVRRACPSRAPQGHALSCPPAPFLGPLPHSGCDTWRVDGSQKAHSGGHHQERGSLAMGGPGAESRVPGEKNWVSWSPVCPTWAGVIPEGRRDLRLRVPPLGRKPTSERSRRRVGGRLPRSGLATLPLPVMPVTEEGALPPVVRVQHQQLEDRIQGSLLCFPSCVTVDKHSGLHSGGGPPASRGVAS